MSRILIWRQIVRGSDIDVFGTTNYRTLYQNIRENYHGHCPNWGNKLWFQGLISAISTPENEVVCRTTETTDEINDQYDLVVYPMANFFSVEYCSDTTALVEALQGIRIPVYIIACGVQAKSYDGLEELVAAIGTPASRFIETVYRTGGEFALRGYFSKEFFNRLGFPSAVVTGCPSLYQLGRNLRIPERRQEPLRPLFNGELKSFGKLLRQYPQSEFFSQEILADCLVDPDYFSDRGLREDLRFLDLYGADAARLLGSGRIKMICDMNDWYQYLKNTGFNFSFGTKIHGTIMPLLAGIPAVILTVDSRTQEMAEFFDLPRMQFQPGHCYTREELLAAREAADYSGFHAAFPAKFDAYAAFLKEKGIVKEINSDNCFFQEPGRTEFMEYMPNQAKFKRYRNRIRMLQPAVYVGRQLRRCR